MSNYINNSNANPDTDEYTLEYQDGEYVKVYKPFICGYKVSSTIYK